MNRRRFLQTTLAAAVTAPICAAEKRPPRIVLRSSWQTVNIGDIAHTPGVLRLLEEHLPEADVRLWPGSVGDGVEEVLLDKLPEDVKAKVVWRERYWLTDEADVQRVAPAVLELARNPAAAKAKAAKAREFVRQRQREMMAVLRRT